jgi:predicted Fe-S protein YdhL (DUF1289 family)
MTSPGFSASPSALRHLAIVPVVMVCGMTGGCRGCGETRRQQQRAESMATQREELSVWASHKERFHRARKPSAAQWPWHYNPTSRALRSATHAAATPTPTHRRQRRHGHGGMGWQAGKAARRHAADLRGRRDKAEERLEAGRKREDEAPGQCAQRGATLALRC